MQVKGIIIKKENMHEPMMDTMERTITLSDKELPEIKKWDINKKYGITLDVLQVSKSSEGEDSATATFKILKATPVGSGENRVAEEDAEESDEDESNEEDDGINFNDYENMEDAVLNSKPRTKK